MRVELEEKEHIYFLNGDMANISITELLAKHKISPDYLGVSKEKLRESAERGKVIHKDLENVVNQREYFPNTIYGEAFQDWAKNNLSCGVGEQPIGYDYNGLLICGTIDLIGFLKKDDTPIIADYKTTSVVHEEAVSWQLSLGDYFLRKLGNETINGKVINWKGAKKFYCFHLKDGKINIVEIPKINDKEIERMLKAEYGGKIYQRPRLVVSKNLKSQFLKAETTLAEIEKQRVEAEKVAKELREKIKALFEKQGIKSWETDNIKVSYVEPMDKMILDSKKVKEIYPNVFAECLKLSKVESQIRIKLKGGKDDGKS